MPQVSKLIGSFSKKEAAQLFTKSKIIFKSPACDIRCAPSTKDFGRILVVTPKRIGIASKRNLVRRRLKAIFYEEKLFEHCLDCIAIIKKGAIDLSFDQLKKLMEKAFSKIGVPRETKQNNK